MERLGQEVIRAHFHPLTHIRAIRARRQENKRNRRRRSIFAQFFQDAIAIHFWHHNVADDQIGQKFTGALHPNQAVFSANGLKPLEAEHFENVFSQRLRVFYDENFLHCSFSLTAKLGNVTVKTVPFAKLAFHGDLTTMQIDSLFDNRQAQTRPGNVIDIFGAVECLEKTFLIFERDTDPMILNFQDEARSFTDHIHLYFTANRRIFDCVRQQICNNSRDQLAIGIDTSAISLAFDTQMMLPTDPFAYGLNRLPNHVLQIDQFRVEFFQFFAFADSQEVIQH